MGVLLCGVLDLECEPVVSFDETGELVVGESIAVVRLLDVVPVAGGVGGDSVDVGHMSELIVSVQEPVHHDLVVDQAGGALVDYFGGGFLE